MFLMIIPLNNIPQVTNNYENNSITGRDRSIWRICKSFSAVNVEVEKIVRSIKSNAKRVDGAEVKCMRRKLILFKGLQTNWLCSVLYKNCNAVQFLLSSSSI